MENKYQKILKNLREEKKWNIWEQELALFLNTWGNLNEIPNNSQDFNDGYKKAIIDIWAKFDFSNILDLKYKNRKHLKEGKK